MACASQQLPNRGIFILPERDARQVRAVQHDGMSHHVFTRGNAKLSLCLVSVLSFCVCVSFDSHHVFLYSNSAIASWPARESFSCCEYSQSMEHSAQKLCAHSHRQESCPPNKCDSRASFVMIVPTPVLMYTQIADSHVWLCCCCSGWHQCPR